MKKLILTTLILLFFPFVAQAITVIPTATTTDSQVSSTIIKSVPYSPFPGVTISNGACNPDIDTSANQMTKDYYIMNCRHLMDKGIGIVPAEPEATTTEMATTTTDLGTTTDSLTTTAGVTDISLASSTSTSQVSIATPTHREQEIIRVMQELVALYQQLIAQFSR